jgi:prephenate dehydrogenase
MKNNNIHGIIGVGDLGSQLKTWLTAVGKTVIAFDTSDSSLSNVVSQAEIFEQADVVHWCAPLHSISAGLQVRTNQHLILHASVMHESLQTKQVIQTHDTSTNNIDIAHLLMNHAKRVVVAAESDDPKMCSEILADCGFNPIVKTVQQHDRMMAVSQAPMAMLHELILNELVELEQNELLTPSGAELLSAIRARAAKWTPATLQSILSNPEINGLISQMQSLIKNKH